MKAKNKKGLIITIILLSILSLGLIGHIVYHKYFMSETNENNTSIEKEKKNVQENPHYNNVALNDINGSDAQYLNIKDAKKYATTMDNLYFYEDLEKNKKKVVYLTI